jgi:hypothetical protein
MFVFCPSAWIPILRTDVPFIENQTSRAACARCPPSHPLVPDARGRLRRRLGGRLERAQRRITSASSAAARAGDIATGPTGARAAAGRVRTDIACLRLPSGRRNRPQNDDGPPYSDPCLEKTGGVLLSQALASQVPSALRGLTALFGMGRGVSPSLKPPEKDERPRLPGPSKLHSATTGTTTPYGASKKSVKPSTD